MTSVEAGQRPSIVGSIGAFLLFVLVWVVVATATNLFATLFYGFTGELGGWALEFFAALLSAFIAAFAALAAIDKWLPAIRRRIVVRTFSVLTIVGGLAGLLPVYDNDYSVAVLSDVLHMVLVGAFAWKLERDPR